MGLDEAIDITAEQRKLLLELLERYLPNTAAWVYGSRAKRTSRPQSDLDLVVFATPEQNGQVGELREAFEESNLPFRVDLFVWDGVPAQFRKHIKRDHVVLEEKIELGTAGDRWVSRCLGEVVDLLAGFPFKSDGYVNHPKAPRLLRGDNIAQGTLRWDGAKRWPHEATVSLTPYWLREGDVVIAMDRPWIEAGLKFSSVRETDLPALLVQRVARLRGSDHLDTRFLKYVIGSRDFTEYVLSVQTGTAVPHISARQIKEFEFSLPPLPEQRAIAQILGTLDDKIELNRRMNETLEAMARAVFKSWFVDFDPVRAKMGGRATGLPQDLADLFPDQLVESELGLIPEGWEVKPLDEIAVFQNGLALQKHRPQINEERLPVVKIAQLRSGKTDSGEWATSNIRPECIINDGDVVFSWSGSLMVTVWCSGRAALNQHLFKVTSTRFPKWFFLHNVRFHLADFQTIAAGKATTMGHIKRHHLSDAVCTVPDGRLLAAVDGPLSAIFERSLSANIQSRILAGLRDTLLPKLISGELRVESATGPC